MQNYLALENTELFFHVIVAMDRVGRGAVMVVMLFKCLAYFYFSVFLA